MKKLIGLLFVFLCVGGVASLLVGFTMSIGILGVIGFVLMSLSAIAGLISNALKSDEQEPTSWSYRPEEGLQHPTKDKAQIPLGGYTSGPS